MKCNWITVTAVLVCSPLFVSCATMSSGTPVKTAFNVPAKASFDDDEPGWLSRNVPGIKTLSDLFPKPSEARTLWDQNQRKQYNRWSSDVNQLP
jgi:hypothetical protein